MTLPASIDTLKSSISRRGGIAKANRFAIYMPHPSKKVSLINTNLSSIISNVAGNVLTGGSIGLGTFFNDPRDVFLFCENVSMPGRQIATNEFFTGLKGVKRPYGFMDDDVTFTFNLTNDYYMFDYLKTWMDQVIIQNKDGSYNVRYKQEYTTDVVIQQLGASDYIPAYSVVLKNAYPITLTTVQLSNSASNQISQISATFTFDVWEKQGFLSGIAQGAATILGAVANDISSITNIGKSFNKS